MPKNKHAAALAKRRNRLADPETLRAQQALGGTTWWASLSPEARAERIAAMQAARVRNRAARANTMISDAVRDEIKANEK